MAGLDQLSVATNADRIIGDPAQRHPHLLARPVEIPFGAKKHKFVSGPEVLVDLSGSLVPEPAWADIDVNSLPVIVTGPATVEASYELPKPFSLDPLHLDVGGHPLEVHARPCREPAFLPESFIIGGTPVARDDLDLPSLQLILEIIEERDEPDGDPFAGVGRDAEDLVDPPLGRFRILAPRRSIRDRTTRTGPFIDEMDYSIPFDKNRPEGAATAVREESKKNVAAKKETLEMISQFSGGKSSNGRFPPSA